MTANTPFRRNPGEARVKTAATKEGAAIEMLHAVKSMAAGLPRPGFHPALIKGAFGANRSGKSWYKNPPALGYASSKVFGFIEIPAPF